MRKIEEIINELPENIRSPLYEILEVVKYDIIHTELGEVKYEMEKAWRAINELAEAQKRTEQRVEELAEAQKKTEERVNELAQRVEELTQRVEELAEAQKRTEQRVEELAEAQKRTEQRVEELAEAQKRTEQRVEELAEAQKRTEQRLEKLIEDHRKTREQLGGLSDAFGYVLEDRAMKSLPKILERDYNINVEEKLKRTYLKVNGEYVEVNIYGKVRKGGEEYTLVGEVKSRISKKMIDSFVNKCDKVSSKVIKVLVCYLFTPEVEEYAKGKGIILIPSYELEL